MQSMCALTSNLSIMLLSSLFHAILQHEKYQSPFINSHTQTRVMHMIHISAVLYNVRKQTRKYVCHKHVSSQPEELINSHATRAFCSGSHTRIDVDFHRTALKSQKAARIFFLQHQQQESRKLTFCSDKSMNIYPTYYELTHYMQLISKEITPDLHIIHNSYDVAQLSFYNLPSNISVSFLACVLDATFYTAKTYKLMNINSNSQYITSIFNSFSSIMIKINQCI